MCEKSRIKDVTGEVYNRFTIIETLGNRKTNNTKYKMVKVLCECGNERTVDYRDLKRGRRKSCGCITEEIKINIEKEAVYNYWTILSEVERYDDGKGNKARKVLAKCVCGKEKEVLLNSLRAGGSKSCGCMTEHKKGKTITLESPIKPLDIDKSNQRNFGYWKITEEISAKRNEKGEIKRTVIAECKCGYQKTVLYENMDTSKKCLTCHVKELKEKADSQPHLIKKVLMNRFNSMKSRCYREKDKNYKSYGRKGITVCDRWLNSFESFYEWSLSNGFEKGLEIDRIDSLKEYSPENCRYITHEENLLNMSCVNLTVEDVLFIRSNDFDVSMCEKYGYKKNVVKNILSGKTFKNIF